MRRERKQYSSSTGKYRFVGQFLSLYVVVSLSRMSFKMALATNSLFFFALLLLICTDAHIIDVHFLFYISSEDENKVSRRVMFTQSSLCRRARVYVYVLFLKKKMSCENNSERIDLNKITSNKINDRY